MYKFIGRPLQYKSASTLYIRLHRTRRTFVTSRPHLGVNSMPEIGIASEPIDTTLSESIIPNNSTCSMGGPDGTKANPDLKTKKIKPLVRRIFYQPLIRAKRSEPYKPDIHAKWRPKPIVTPATHYTVIFQVFNEFTRLERAANLLKLPVVALKPHLRELIREEEELLNSTSPDAASARLRRLVRGDPREKLLTNTASLLYGQHPPGSEEKQEVANESLHVVNTRTLLLELHTELDKILASTHEQRAFIRAERTSYHHHVSEAMRIMKALKGNRELRWRELHAEEPQNPAEPVVCAPHLAELSEDELLRTDSDLHDPEMTSRERAETQHLIELGESSEATTPHELMPWKPIEDDPDRPPNLYSEPVSNDDNESIGSSKPQSKQQHRFQSEGQYYSQFGDPNSDGVFDNAESDPGEWFSPLEKELNALFKDHTLTEWPLEEDPKHKDEQIARMKAQLLELEEENFKLRAKAT